MKYAMLLLAAVLAVALLSGCVAFVLCHTAGNDSHMRAAPWQLGWAQNAAPATNSSVVGTVPAPEKTK